MPAVEGVLGHAKIMGLQVSMVLCPCRAFCDRAGNLIYYRLSGGRTGYGLQSTSPPCPCKERRYKDGAAKTIFQQRLDQPLCRNGHPFRVTNQYEQDDYFRQNS
jgi:hypothetical protein